MFMQPLSQQNQSNEKIRKDLRDTWSKQQKKMVKLIILLSTFYFLALVYVSPKPLINQSISYLFLQNEAKALLNGVRQKYMMLGGDIVKTRQYVHDGNKLEKKRKELADLQAKVHALKSNVNIDT